MAIQLKPPGYQCLKDAPWIILLRNCAQKGLVILPVPGDGILLLEGVIQVQVFVVLTVRLGILNGLAEKRLGSGIDGYVIAGFRPLDGKVKPYET